MSPLRTASLLVAVALASFACRVPAVAAEDDDAGPLRISGIYPHLAAFSTPEGGKPAGDHGECGIGAVVPWADRLWFITYPPHKTRGGRDKLYEVDEQLNLTVRPESVGGTHANRLIHRESDQLIIGPYFIDARRNVRAADLNKLVGRMTATARHLADPANKVYFYDMEGALYEADVHTLAVTRLFEKPVPGWHGKGAYTGQGRLIVANNGEHAAGSRGYEPLVVGGPAKSEDEAGALAEWDGQTWRIVERKKFTDVTGPGGIHGAPSDDAPVWSMGWDKRSVILMLLDGGKWHRFRTPKGSHTFDPTHGWFTEWPRIRQVTGERFMMVMHGTMFDFPPGFRAADTGGLRPMATHLRYIPDFCDWNGRLVVAADDASMMGNPMVGQPQSNLWFGSLADLPRFGPRSGWGGVWVGDTLESGDVSDPFLIRGYDDRCLHIAVNAPQPVTFTIELDRDGRGDWQAWRDITVSGYGRLVLPRDLDAQWLRLRSGGECIATAYFHMHSPRPAAPNEGAIFAGLAKAGNAAGYTAGIIRPAGHNRGLQLVSQSVGGDGQAGDPRYLEVTLGDDHRDLVFQSPDTDRSDEVKRVASIQKPFEVDDASIIMIGADKKRYRLPRGDAAFDKPLPTGWPRGVREAVSERFLANLHGSFYEIPRADYHGVDVQRIKPVCTHNRIITDFCTWRGLLVLAGASADAGEDGHVFRGEGAGLWFGHIDDLWRLGKPVGVGGPWKDSPVKAGEPSDPYLMTGYDRKTLTLSHDADEPVTFTVEINFDHRYWRQYRRFTVPAGEPVSHAFEDGFHAHWVRVTADRDCKATAWLVYE